PSSPPRSAPARALPPRRRRRRGRAAGAARRAPARTPRRRARAPRPAPLGTAAGALSAVRSAAAEDRLQIERARLVIVDEEPPAVAPMEPERRAQLARELVLHAGDLEARHVLHVDERRVAGDRDLPGELVPPAHAEQDLPDRVPVLRDPGPVVDRVGRLLGLVDEAGVVLVPERLHGRRVDRLEGLRPLLVDADDRLLGRAVGAHATLPSMDSSRTTLFGRLNSGITYFPMSSRDFMSFWWPMPSMRITTS